MICNRSLNCNSSSEQLWPASPIDAQSLNQSIEQSLIIGSLHCAVSLVSCVQSTAKICLRVVDIDVECRTKWPHQSLVIIRSICIHSLFDRAALANHVIDSYDFSIASLLIHRIGNKFVRLSKQHTDNCCVHCRMSLLSTNVSVTKRLKIEFQAMHRRSRLSPELTDHLSPDQQGCPVIPSIVNNCPPLSFERWGSK